MTCSKFTTLYRPNRTNVITKRGLDPNDQYCSIPLFLRTVFSLIYEFR